MKKNKKETTMDIKIKKNYIAIGGTEFGLGLGFCEGLFVLMTLILTLKVWVDPGMGEVACQSWKQSL